MDDSCSRRYTRLTREFRAMASHNRSIAAAMERYYDKSIAAATARLAGSGDTRRHPQYDAVQRLASSAVECAGRTRAKSAL